ncbi:hypothetical protein ARMGADRAFT_572455 [Armillaria gallica]|uniref:Uncharacterized protein n=1 Tax=Armillaria gallica TaxID=47427 RepID=A0A2H3DSQ6_ARMGA|nr:hypothetical protein ARMGADRAFT_572455 [Armillaria gallica]
MRPNTMVLHCHPTRGRRLIAARGRRYPSRLTFAKLQDLLLFFYCFASFFVRPLSLEVDLMHPFAIVRHTEWRIISNLETRIWKRQMGISLRLELRY